MTSAPPSSSNPQNLPIRFKVLCNLPSVGVDISHIGFATYTLESDAYVCIRDTQPGATQPEVAIVNLKDNNNVVRRRITADSAMMHWSRGIIALRQQRTLQVSDLEKRVKVNTLLMNQDVVFWKWISETAIGIVTETAVFHWNVHETQPVEMFKRNPEMEGRQIINYRVDADGKWMVLIGIKSEAGRASGQMQLFSKDRGLSQNLEGHAAAFGTLHLDGAPEDTKVFAFAARPATGPARLHIVEIDHRESNPVFKKRVVEVYFPNDAATDFPVSVQASQKYGVVFMVTKHGYIHLYDMETASCIFVNRISNEIVFTACADSASSGMVAINRAGQVLHVTVDENNLIPYVRHSLSDPGIALSMATRAGLPGVQDLLAAKLDDLLNSRNFTEAAKLAVNSPGGCLRTDETLGRFKTAPFQPGEMLPTLHYFGALLDKGNLTENETLELIVPCLSQSRIDLLRKWLSEGKLHCSERFGDLVRPVDVEMSVEVYRKAGAHPKYIAGLVQRMQLNEILAYEAKTGYQPDYPAVLQHLILHDPAKAQVFAESLAAGGKMDLGRILDLFQSKNLVQEATSVGIDALKDDLEEFGPLQTRVLELNLANAPQVAEAILTSHMFSHFDKPRIAVLCENAGLGQRALELTSDPEAVKRIVAAKAGSAELPVDWLVQYFGELSVDQSLDCLEAMLKHNIRGTLESVVRIATKYSDLLGPVHLIELFEKYKTAEGLYHYLGSIVNVSDDPDVVFKYIEAASQMGQYREVERVCRDSEHYDPEKVKNFLKEANLPEQLPLIIVCDRFNFVHDLVLYLYQHQKFQAIEAYVQRVNPARAPAVVGALLDVDCDEDVVRNLLASVDAASIPVDDLVSEVESRNRLKLLLPFLEASLASGGAQQGVHNALAKIYIDSNNNPEKFLKENDLYDTLVVGRYCEKRDPNLAFIAYSKGRNDLELVGVTNENSMYRAQARYLLERADRELWSAVLAEDNIHRRSVVDQVASTAVPESTDPAKVSVAVASFLEADLPLELIELLEKIVLEPSPFSDNPSIQNLLMFTAAKADKSRVMDYVHRLGGYTVAEIAPACVEVGLHEEAFEIYKKHEDPTAAVDVLVEHIGSVERAHAYAEDVDVPEVWSRVAKAHLDAGEVAAAVDSYIKAADPRNHPEVISVAAGTGVNDEDLVRFLRMVRRTRREPPVDTALAYCLARLGQLSELEDFLRGIHVANVEESGDKAYSDGLYEAAKIFYASIANWAKLATTLVYLGDHQTAVDCARKANNVKVWREVHEACVDKKEFRLAQICGQHLIVDAEQLQDLVRLYERHGYFDELISLLEQGLGLERAHMGMFTELGIALSRYHPERLAEHLKLFWSRMNLPKIIRACEEAHLWPELVFCHYHFDEFDNAVMAVMEHPENSWEHQQFKESVVKVGNLELYYRSVKFYLEQHPSLLTDLLAALTPRIDVNRVVKMFQKSDDLPLIKPFLVNVQHQNKRAVNDAINDLLIEEEDYKTLRDSVTNHDNYDSAELASRLEKHDLIFFRQIAAGIYRRNKSWGRSIALSKQDKLYKDAIETAALSGKPEVVEELLQYFVDIGNRECYVGILYACYDLIRPDRVLELSWRYGLTDFTMPYMINMLCQQTSKIATLEADSEARKAREKEQEKSEDNGPILAGSRLMITAGPSTLASQPTGSSAYGQINGFAPQASGLGF